MKRMLWMMFVGSCAAVGGSAAGKVCWRLEPLAAAQSKPASTGATAARGSLSQIGNCFEQVARMVAPAVVYVEAAKPPSAPTGTVGKAQPVEESGSGVIIRAPEKHGFLVLTNNHVISGAKPEQITISLGDGRLFHPARLWTDPESDVAVLRLDNTGDLPAAALGNSDDCRVGQWVLAIGSPFGLNQTVTHGIVSAKDRGQISLGSTIRIKDFLQTDAAINPGSSGGPLVNLDGEIIGLNTAIASRDGNSSGVAFSIPVNLVKRVMRQLLEKGRVTRGYLGLQLAGAFEPADALKLGLDSVRGALVEIVFPGTPAADAGLRANDVVLQVDSIPIRNENHLINLISALPAGQKVRLQVWRDHKNTSLEATVGDWSKGQNRFGPTQP